MSRSVTTAGTFMGPIVAGFCYDLTKSYTIPFTIFAGVALLATLCMFMARPPGGAKKTEQRNSTHKAGSVTKGKG
jgi:cyanate permease